MTTKSDCLPYQHVHIYTLQNHFNGFKNDFDFALFCSLCPRHIIYIYKFLYCQFSSTFFFLFCYVTTFFEIYGWFWYGQCLKKYLPTFELELYNRKVQLFCNNPRKPILGITVLFLFVQLLLYNTIWLHFCGHFTFFFVSF